MKRSIGKDIRVFLWTFSFLYITSLNAQSAREVAVEITAVKTANNNTELHWKSDTGVIRYFVYKRPHIDSNWVLLDSMVATTLKFTDTQSRLGSSMEYRVAKKKNNFSFLGNGYITAGFNLPAQSDKGIALLIIDSNYIVPAKQDIQDYIAQLQNEGFEVVRKTVLRTESVSNIKSWIFQQYQKDTQRLKCVLLMGHVPVPYSGDISPDGHTDHRGAWPADNFYGSFYSSWTDITVNRTTASRPANRNTPGDGKFDLSRLNPVGTTWKNTKRYQLPVGRIDFFDMPAFGSDTVLLKRYLKKNLAFRTKQVSFSPKGLVDDNFGYFAGEAFASGGYRNFSAFFGDSIVDGDYTGTGTGMKTTKYLWSYGCGGGSYTSCSGVSNTIAMAQDSLLNPFTMVFGSYFGDWDNQNNFLRAPIASKGWGLAAAWAGRPYWMMHEAALGAPLYQCVKSTYNCTNVYSVGSSGSGVHVALMGDPTLRVFPVANVFSVTAKADCSGKLLLKWQQSTDQADSIVIELWQNNHWNLVGTITGIDTQFVKILSPGKYQISLREKKLMSSASGTWWDLGARSIIVCSVNLSDTPKIVTNASRLCSGDTFDIAAIKGKNSKILGWEIDGKSMSKNDSFWSLLSRGQGLIKLKVLVQTDSGCLSFDSLVVTAVVPDQLTWNPPTDSTLSVHSTLKLPISWYRNDTLLSMEKDSILRIKQSGLYRAMSLADGFCASSTDTFRYTLPSPIWAVKSFNLSPLCNEGIRASWQKDEQSLDSLFIYESRSGQIQIQQAVSTSDTNAFVFVGAGNKMLGIGGKKRVKVISGLRWDLSPVVWDTISVFPSDTLDLLKQDDTLIIGRSARSASIQWYRNDTLISFQGTNFVPHESGRYRICTRIQDSCLRCSDTINFVYKPFADVERMKKRVEYSVFPNPANTSFTIEPVNGVGELCWQVFDLNGVIIIKGKGRRVDVSNLTRGCYYLLIEQEASLLFLKQ